MDNIVITDITPVWDTSYEDAANVMMREYPDHVVRTQKCLRSIANNNVIAESTIRRYAKNWGLNEDKIFMMMS